MQDSFENASVSGILERTPKREPFYSETRRAVQKLREADLSHNPLYGIIHGQIGALMEAGKLGPDWTTRRVPGGAVVSHRDFLNIQDEFASIEGHKADAPVWNAEMSLDALGNYIGTMRQYRNRHSSLFGEALTQIPNSQRQVIQQRLEKHKHLLEDPDNFVMVAIPSHLDNPKLWESFGLRGKLLDRIGPWSKINEQGVILASRLHRDDNPRGHDYFAYAAKEQRERRVSSMTEMLANRTGKHEGSHGITDALFMDLLDIDAYNPIYEGFVGALGEDGREKRQSVPFRQFISDPYPRNTKQRMDNAYYAGSKYWTSLKQALINKGNPNPWPILINEGLSLATDINSINEVMAANPDVRITKFLKELPARMNIDLDDVENHFDSLGAES